MIHECAVFENSHFALHLETIFFNSKASIFKKVHTEKSRVCSNCKQLAFHLDVTLLSSTLKNASFIVGNCPITRQSHCLCVGGRGSYSQWSRIVEHFCDQRRISGEGTQCLSRTILLVKKIKEAKYIWINKKRATIIYFFPVVAASSSLA